jgi:hypothetical protein
MLSIPEYASEVENDPEREGELRLKLPLSFRAIAALFAKIMVDTQLPRVGSKRRLGEAEAEEPADTTTQKLNSITVSKSTVTGYKAALMNYYSDRKIKFECEELSYVDQSIDDYLNEQIKSYGNIIAIKRVCFTGILLL